MVKAKLQIPARRIVAIGMMVMAAFLARAATEEVLWWQVPTDPTVYTFTDGNVSASSLGVTDARIRDSNGDYLVIPMDVQGTLVEGDSSGVPMGKAWFAYLPDSPEGLSFLVELGNWDAEEFSWVGIAQSRSYTFEELSSHIIQDWSGPNATPAIQPWVADGYVVPEPSSGILLLIGGGLLALRRKRRE